MSFHDLATSKRYVLHFFMSKNVYIRTFGCQMNVHDSEKIAGIMEQEGYTLTEDPHVADLIIFNTCSIRQKAEQKFYSELGRLTSKKNRKPGSVIAVAGCIAQMKGGAIFKKARHVDFVFGPQNLHVLRDFLTGKASHIAIDDNPELAHINLPAKRAHRAKAWVTIMYGCNNFCSYCVVPYARGRERSRPSGHIMNEIRQLSADGYREFTLLGQNVNSYKSDVDFPGLLRRIETIRTVGRLRFVTSHPRDLSGDLISAMKELPSVCEHIHLPLQSGSSRILRLMNRGYTYDEYREKAMRLREEIPGISITSDIISSFPGESAEDHQMTIQALQEIQFDGIFAFKFSPRKGTLAASIKNHLPDDVRTERIEDILGAQDMITTQKNKALEGTIQEVLIEGASKTDPLRLTGRTRTNKIVNIPLMDIQPGTLIPVKIVRARRHSLEGIPHKDENRYPYPGM
jgi:tRNA-2-methylthio-N6-dimethylallyladenosine synthase